MNWKKVLMAVGGLFLGLILVSTVFSAIFVRRRGTCPAVVKGQQILKQAEQQDTEDSEELL